jgi:hypothetical protein
VNCNDPEAKHEKPNVLTLLTIEASFLFVKVKLYTIHRLYMHKSMSFDKSIHLCNYYLIKIIYNTLIAPEIFLMLFLHKQPDLLCHHRLSTLEPHINSIAPAAQHAVFNIHLCCWVHWLIFLWPHFS